MGSQQFVPSLILVCLYTTHSCLYTIERAQHKEEVYSTSIFVSNSGIHAVCLAIAAIAAARANQNFAFLFLFAETRRFEASEGPFGACESLC